MFEIRNLPDMMPGKVVLSSSGCWIWTGAVTKGGYGQKIYRYPDGRRAMTTAHRASWMHFVGPLNAGIELDHLCHTQDPSCARGDDCMHRRCINPEHLEPVSRRENAIRGRGFVAENLSKTHCPAGHPYSPENTYPSAPGKRHRVCKTCKRARQAVINGRLRAGG